MPICIDVETGVPGIKNLKFSNRYPPRFPPIVIAACYSGFFSKRRRAIQTKTSFPPRSLLCLFLLDGVSAVFVCFPIRRRHLTIRHDIPRTRNSHLLVYPSDTDAPFKTHCVLPCQCCKWFVCFPVCQWCDLKTTPRLSCMETKMDSSRMFL